MEERFCRAESLLGRQAMEKLANSRVAVVGLGGVGSWCAEALARSGVGELILLDQDTVSRSNINRQLCAQESTIGKSKAEVMAGRARDIAPDCRVRAVIGCYNKENRSILFDFSPDYIVDAIDLVSCKIDLILTAREKGIPVISALGTGNKTDAGQLCITDIAKTQGCPLARVVRRELRRVDIHHHTVVYSPQEALQPAGTETPPPGRRSVPGSLVFVTATAGMLLAQHVVTELIRD